LKEEISERFLSFAATIIELGREINKSFEGKHVYQQLFRSGSSAGANYEESHSAQSKRDFIHKREVSLKELRESLFWLKLIEKAALVKEKSGVLKFLLTENDELIRIMAKSVKTTKERS